LGRDTCWTRTRANETEGQEDVQHAQTADGATKSRVKDNVDDHRKVAKKEILFPIARPREIEEQGSHLEANNN
jgi:hypothetical protein